MSDVSAVLDDVSVVTIYIYILNHVILFQVLTLDKLIKKELHRDFWSKNRYSSSLMRFQIIELLSASSSSLYTQSKNINITQDFVTSRYMLRIKVMK